MASVPYLLRGRLVVRHQTPLTNLPPPQQACACASRTLACFDNECIGIVQKETNRLFSHMHFHTRRSAVTLTFGIHWLPASGHVDRPAHVVHAHAAPALLHQP